MSKHDTESTPIASNGIRGIHLCAQFLRCHLISSLCKFPFIRLLSWSRSPLQFASLWLTLPSLCSHLRLSWDFFSGSEIQPKHRLSVTSPTVLPHLLALYYVTSCLNFSDLHLIPKHLEVTSFSRYCLYLLFCLSSTSVFHPDIRLNNLSPWMEGFLCEFRLFLCLTLLSTFLAS